MHEAGCVFGLETKAPYLSDDDKRRRLEWALAHQHWDWQRVIFSDEATFFMRTLRRRVWHQRGSIPTWETRKYCQKFQAYGCFSEKGQGVLWFFDGTLNAKVMIDLYENALVPSIDLLYAGDTTACLLLEDNDSKHKASLCEDWKQEHNIEVLDFPPYSPDLNPIEEMWAYLKHSVQWGQGESKLHFQHRLQTCWKNISSSNYARSMQKRVEKCIEAGGGSVK